jgi:hypothetical protein
MTDESIKERGNNLGRLGKYLEIYKCAVLTAMAAILCCIWLNPRTPLPVRVIDLPDVGGRVWEGGLFRPYAPTYELEITPGRK